MWLWSQREYDMSSYRYFWYLKTAILGPWKVLEFCPFSLLWTLFDTIVMCCFSGCRNGCGGLRAVSGWCSPDWRPDCFTVGRGFCRWTAPDAWASRRDLTSFRLTDKTACGGASQQPCCLLHLSDVVSTHESTWSVAQSTAQRHCRVALPSSLGHPFSLFQEALLADDRLRTMCGLFQFSAG